MSLSKAADEKINDFRRWQKKFYKSKVWLLLRDQIRDDHKNRCSICGNFIRSKYIVDHIIAITPENKHDISITLNPDNLRLLCFQCHNSRTFGDQIDYELSKRKDVNLF